MDKFIKEVDNIISNCSNQINENIIGINYLEKIKYPLIDNIRKLNLASFNCENHNNGHEIKKILGDNELIVSLQTYSESLSKTKYLIQRDNLSIIVRGFKSISVFDNQINANSFYLSLFTNTGVVLSKNTSVVEKISKNSIILDIINAKENQDVEK